MPTLFRLLVIAALAAIVAIPVAAFADEPENYEADAQKSSGNPPTIPHKVSDAATSDDCLACHRDGLKGSQQTTHPDRMGCTQCHVQGEVKEKKMPKKSKVTK
jgi:nitrate reductase cytochrome c-type subunit